nr:hypothetical protein [Labrenzia sp. DG1229]
MPYWTLLAYEFSDVVRATEALPSWRFAAPVLSKRRSPAGFPSRDIVSVAMISTALVSTRVDDGRDLAAINCQILETVVAEQVQLSAVLPFLTPNPEHLQPYGQERPEHA